MSTRQRLRIFAGVLLTAAVSTLPLDAQSQVSISSLSPQVYPANGQSFQLTVNGTDFCTLSGVRFNGFTVQTTFVSSIRLTANISGGLVHEPGTVQVQVVNPAGAGDCPAGTASANMVIAPLLQITTQSLIEATLGSAYSWQVDAQGGYQGRTWSAVGLPAGLGINASSGIISGTPTLAGTFTVRVTVRDSINQTSERSFSLLIRSPLRVTGPASLPPGQVNTAYTAQQFTADGGTPPYTWRAVGSLPPGLSLNTQTGVLSGTPTQFGVYGFSIDVQDSTGARSQPVVYSINVGNAQPQITTSEIPRGRVGQSYSTTLQASGGSPPYTWAALSMLPSGLVLTPEGVLSGTPIQTANTAMTVAVIDSQQQSAQRTFSLVIDPPRTTIHTSPSGLAILVDGSSVTAPHSTDWTPGTPHAIAAPSPQYWGQTRYVFSHWSNGGSQSQVIEAPAAEATYTAVFTQQHLLTLLANPPGGGMVAVTPSGDDGFHAGGSTVQVTASSNPGYVFTGFSGSLAGEGNPQSLIMSSPRNVTANFSCVYVLDASSISVGNQSSTSSLGLTTGSGCTWAVSSNTPWITVTSAASGTGTTTVSFLIDANLDQNPRSGTITIVAQPFTVRQAGLSSVAVTVGSDPAGLVIQVDGAPHTTPQVFHWTPGSTHTISAASPQGPAGTRHVFTAWNDGGGQLHTITVPVNPAVFTASFATSYLLTTSVYPSAAGTVSVTPSSADYYYSAGAIVQLSAISATGYQFVGWSGGVAGAASNITLAMNGSKEVTANFTGPPDCNAISLSTQHQSMGWTGGTFQVTVTTQAECRWTAVTTTNWIAPGNSSGIGSASLTLTVLQNLGSSARTAKIDIAGQSVHVVQRPPAPNQIFADVPASHPYWEHISMLREAGVTTGCTATQYCPDGFTTRGQMAVFIVRSLMSGDSFNAPSFPYFTDVPANHPHFRHIQKMRELGITTGCTATTYCPDESVTRGQMAVLIVRAGLRLAPGQEPRHNPTPYFRDVIATHPFFAFIQRMREMGITTGCAAERYCPDGTTTRGQMAVFLVRAFLTP